MSPTENTESTSMNRLRLLAQMSGSPDIEADADEFQEISDQEEGIRERIEQMQRDIQLLSSAA